MLSADLNRYPHAKSLSKPLFRVARASAALTASSTNPARARPFGKLTSQSSNS